MHFLRVVTLYSEDPDADQYTAEAMFHAGELFAELRPTNPTTDEDKEAYRQGRLRALREFDDCARRFPNSSWARRATEARAQLR